MLRNIFPFLPAREPEARKNVERKSPAASILRLDGHWHDENFRNFPSNLVQRTQKQATGLTLARLNHWHNMAQFAVAEKNVLAAWQAFKLWKWIRNNSQMCFISIIDRARICGTAIDGSSLTIVLIKTFFVALLGSIDGSGKRFYDDDAEHQMAAKLIAAFRISLNFRDSNISFMLFWLIACNIQSWTKADSTWNLLIYPATSINNLQIHFYASAFAC